MLRLETRTSRPAETPALSRSPTALPFAVDAAILATTLGATCQDTASGPCYVVSSRSDSSAQRGRIQASDALALDSDTLAWLTGNPHEAGILPSNIAFVDCETTGLSGGTGTYAFLVGIAHFEGRDLVARQYFLPDYDAEPAFLEAIDAALSPFRAIASFNGKAFDLGLLETRFALARRSPEWLIAPHLDVLHPSRRIWRRRLDSCALGVLEERVLGVTRDNDAPGWLVPSLYFQYLRTGDPLPLKSVFEHNHHDLHSLIGLLAKIGRLVTMEDQAEHALDKLSLGRWMEDRGLPERAVEFYEAALRQGLAGRDRSDAYTRLGLVHKRMRSRENAVKAWDEASDRQGGQSIVALVELAKHHEHVARDLPAAAEYTRRALALADDVRSPIASEVSLAALTRRLARLEKRMSRSGTSDKTSGRSTD